MADPSPDRYSVNIPAVIRERFLLEADWARPRGLLDDLRAALREIELRLAVEPLDWGESRETLEHLGLQMRCGMSRMVTVLYGVSERHRAVFVKDLRYNRNYRPRPGGGG
jgi:hypothetical protein